jgi:hypothetical protein
MAQGIKSHLCRRCGSSPRIGRPVARAVATAAAAAEGTSAATASSYAPRGRLGLDVVGGLSTTPAAHCLCEKKAYSPGGAARSDLDAVKFSNCAGPGFPLALAALVSSPVWTCGGRGGGGGGGCVGCGVGRGCFCSGRLWRAAAGLAGSFILAVLVPRRWTVWGA